MIPGEYHVASEPIDYNGGYEAISLEVKNVGDRAAQVGSHYHFYEANEAGLQFDRQSNALLPEYGLDNYAEPVHNLYYPLNLLMCLTKFHPDQKLHFDT